MSHKERYAGREGKDESEKDTHKEKGGERERQRTTERGRT
jgi:hypothetical protein